MLSVLVIALLSALAGAQPNVQLGGEVRTLLPRLAQSMNRQAEIARKCIAKWNVDPKERLAAVYLNANRHEWRDRLAACSITYLHEHVGRSTPLDVFMFVPEEMYNRVDRTLNQFLEGDALERVCLIPIPPEQWMYHLPRATPYQLPGNTNRYNEYLYMGQWRLLVPFNVIGAVGYPYALQIDDDLVVQKPFEVNIVQHMKENKMLIANHRLRYETWEIMRGLPELAKFFLESNSLQPGTSILDHVYPQGTLNSLYSPHVRINGKDPSTHSGFDLSYLWGNFLVMSTELWQDPKVQDFVALCISSGGLERHRWQEQGVMAFVWLLFTDKEQLWVLEQPDFDYYHGKKPLREHEKCRPIYDGTGLYDMPDKKRKRKSTERLLLDKAVQFLMGSNKKDKQV